MAAYVLRRIALLVPVWLGVSLFAFLLSNLAPGDPAHFILLQRTGEAPSEQEIEALREQLGLNDPFPVRFARWAVDAASGDLGTSYRSGRPVLDELWRHSVLTLQLAVPAFVIALAISIPVGVIAALKRNSLLDHVSRVAALIADSLPAYWLGYMLMVVFAVRLRLLPVAGSGSLAHVVLPAVTLGVGTTATLMRLTRSSLLEVLSEDYVRTARAKGLPESRVIALHALKNALIPVITVAGLLSGHFLTGAVIVETVFAWPGVGQYVVEAILNRDYPVVQGFVVYAGTIFVLINLVVDLLYVWLDPRVRLAGRM